MAAVKKKNKMMKQKAKKMLYNDRMVFRRRPHILILK